LILKELMQVLLMVLLVALVIGLLMLFLAHLGVSGNAIV
jgi:hypothetical protein